MMTVFDIGVSDGLNEKGLAAHLLALSDSKPEPKDDRPELPNAYWVPYVLDNFSIVKEVVDGRV